MTTENLENKTEGHSLQDVVGHRELEPSVERRESSGLVGAGGVPAKIIDSNLPPPIENPSIFRRILNRFCAYETMSGNGACPVYLERWTVAEAWNCGVYLHHFLGDDWAIDPHDHPRRFISIGLKGWYWEDVFKQVVDNEFGQQIPVTELVSTTRYKAPWLRSFAAEHLHRVRAVECGDCWTLVIVLPKTRRWGFVQDGKWIGFKDYVFGGKARKSC